MRRDDLSGTRFCGLRSAVRGGARVAVGWVLPAAWPLEPLDCGHHDGGPFGQDVVVRIRVAGGVGFCPIGCLRHELVGAVSLRSRSGGVCVADDPGGLRRLCPLLAFHDQGRPHDHPRKLAERRAAPGDFGVVQRALHPCQPQPPHVVWRDCGSVAQYAAGLAHRILAWPDGGLFLACSVVDWRRSAASGGQPDAVRGEVARRVGGHRRDGCALASVPVSGV